jgi:hypothetical protein
MFKTVFNNDGFEKFKIKDVFYNRQESGEVDKGKDAHPTRFVPF